MGTIKGNLNKLQTDKLQIIQNYKDAGVVISDDATFTDVNNAFSSLPIMDVTVEGNALVFNSSAYVENNTLVIGGSNE